MERQKNGENGKKNGTEWNGMERTIKRNGTETEHFFNAYCTYYDMGGMLWIGWALHSGPFV